MPTATPVLRTGAVDGLAVVADRMTPGGTALKALVPLARRLTTTAWSWSPITAPLYALLQGPVIGALPASFEARFPGLVLRAVGPTFGVVLGMPPVDQTGLIEVAERFRLGVAAATLGIPLCYPAGFALSFFGIFFPPLFAAGGLPCRSTI